MPLTRAEADTLLLARCGGKLAFVGLAVAPAAGAVACLTGPLLEGLRACGVAPIDPIAVADADLATLDDGALPLLLDVAEWRALEDVLGQWDRADQTAGPANSYSFGAFYSALEKTVERKRKQLTDRYGYGGALGAAPAVADIATPARVRYPWPTGYWPCP